MAWGTVGHHLRILRQQSLIEIVRVGRAVHIVPAAHDPPHPVLAAPLARRILQTMIQTGPAGPTRISREASTTPRRVHSHLQLLEAAGLIAVDDSYHPQYALTPQGRGAAADLAPGILRK